MIIFFIDQVNKTKISCFRKQKIVVNIRSGPTKPKGSGDKFNFPNSKKH